jgi:hypothetical protein
MRPKKRTWKVSHVSATFVQEADSCDDAKNLGIQELIIQIDDAGGGPFFVISTDRWAFDDPKDIVECIEVVSKLLTNGK